jgi:hypothetical protein
VANMNPDVVVAVEDLRRRGKLTENTARLLARIARGDLVSAHTELRAALYAGVLLLTSGVGVLLKDNLARLGPPTIATSVGLAAALCLLWVARHAPRFDWGETPAEHLAFDYILLLGVLLGSADLAYIEAQFTPLGSSWPWHLLIVSLAMGAAAVRYDSRVVFSLALSTFAAWRGVSASLVELRVWSFAAMPGTLRANAIGCGVLFLLIGFFLRQAERKAHFEPSAVHMGWIAILAALISGIGTTTAEELLFSLAVVVTGAGLTIYAAMARRFTLLSIGLLAAYVAVCALFHRLHPADTLAALWYTATSLALLAGLFLAHQKLKEPE